MTVAAIVPAYDAASSVADTVRALRGIGDVDRIVVVDDGSTDTTGEVARAAGAEVVRLEGNLGKGGAVRAGLAHVAGAEFVLLIDADTGSTADAATGLLPPVQSGAADLTIAVLPSAGGRGGFGIVNSTARALIRRATGLEMAAPLSGQRAARADLLEGIAIAERFGMEVAMTIDAHRVGATILEIPLPFDHHHTGRSWAGFVHRARQGLDIVRATLPRVLRR